MESEKYADMVSQHYDYHNKNEINNVGNYKVNNDYTDTNSAVFTSPNEVVIAMRGTDLQEQKSRNILGAIGTETATQIAQFPNVFSVPSALPLWETKNSYNDLVEITKNKIENLKNIYPNKEIVLAGHSRSGKVVIDLGKEENLRTYSYNPASLPHDVGRGRMERMNKYLFNKNPDYDPEKINIYITGHPQERIKYQQTLGTIALAEMMTGGGATPLLSVGVANLPIDTRREDIVSSFAGYGLENVNLVEPKNVIMRGRGDKWFEKHTHHSIKNFVSENIIPIKEEEEFKTKEIKPKRQTTEVLQSNNIKCILNPNNPLCRRKTTKK